MRVDAQVKLPDLSYEDVRELNLLDLEHPGSYEDLVDGLVEQVVLRGLSCLATGST